MELAQIFKVVERLIKETDRDLLAFSGPIIAQNADTFIKRISALKEKRQGVTLFLCTYGGDPHAAYRMARFLRRQYPGEIRVLIGGYCKSAGTLVALTGDSLGFSDVGELGPLDTQLTRPDEVVQMASGLEVFSTLQYLTDHAFNCFEGNMLKLLERSGQTISTRLASEIATKLATGLMKPITAQLDPMRIGIAQRGLEVTKVYGRQLASVKNVKVDADTLVSHLVNDYPTHSFVIDQDEAQLLFNNVNSFSPLEQEFYELFRQQLTIPQRDFIVNFNLALMEQERTSNAAHEDETDGHDQSSKEGGPRKSSRRATRREASSRTTEGRRENEESSVRSVRTA